MNEMFFIIDCIILALQLISLVTNGTVVYLFFRVVDLNNSSNLRQMLFLCISDFVLAVTALPYVLYLTINWKTFGLNYEPRFMMISALPYPIQLKLHLTIMISSATSRILALTFPAMFRRLDHKMYANLSVVLGLCIACLDIFVLFWSTPIVQHPGCAAFGCFASVRFRYYWGSSNMLLGAIVIVLTGIFMIEMKTIVNNQKRSNQEQEKFRKANRISQLMLCSSMLFITTPSVVIGIVEFFGYPIFRRIGPFYLIGLLLAGVSNSILNLVFNNDIRKFVKTTFSGRIPSTVNGSISAASNGIPMDGLLTPVIRSLTTSSLQIVV